MNIKRMPANYGDFAIDADSLEVVRDAKAPHLPVLKATGGGGGEGGGAIHMIPLHMDANTGAITCDEDVTVPSIMEDLDNGTMVMVKMETLIDGTRDIITIGLSEVSSSSDISGASMAKFDSLDTSIMLVKSGSNYIWSIS